MVEAHEQTYKGVGISQMVHTSRRDKLLGIFQSLNIKPQGGLADFGCSNGYFIELLQKKVFSGKLWKFFGFDFAEDLLKEARAKQLLDTEFAQCNLNKVTDSLNECFDLVSCFETLEHVADYKSAFCNLYNSCKLNGKIIVSVPNEVGFPGLLKFIGRKILRKNPYGNFFKGQDEGKYIKYLFTNGPIEEFRKPTTHGYGPHLGFNWRSFEKHVFDEYLMNGKCKILAKEKTLLGLNIIYLLEKNKSTQKKKQEKTMISFDDFKKIELKTAKILEAKEHPNADKLYVLKIQVGEEQKQIVAGIRAHYTTEELIGKTIVVVNNLEPVVLRGEESQGMLLCASDAENLALLTPEKDIICGSQIR